MKRFDAYLDVWYEYFAKVQDDWNPLDGNPCWDDNQLETLYCLVFTSDNKNRWYQLLLEDLYTFMKKIYEWTQEHPDGEQPSKRFMQMFKRIGRAHI